MANGDYAKLSKRLDNLKAQLRTKEDQLARIAGRGMAGRIVMGSGSAQMTKLNNEIAELNRSIETISKSIARLGY